MASDAEYDAPHDPKPSGYFSSVLGGQQATARKPVTINIDNPINTAKAWPIYHVGVDEKKQPVKGGFEVRLAKLDSLNSQSLIASALTPNHRYGPNTVAFKRTVEAAATARNAGAKPRTPTVNPAPKLKPVPTRNEAAIANETSPREKNSGLASQRLNYDEVDFAPRQKRHAAVVGEKKRKRQDNLDSQSEDSDEHVAEGGSEQGQDDESIRSATRKSRAPRRSLRKAQSLQTRTRSNPRLRNDKSSKSSPISISASSNNESTIEITQAPGIEKKRNPGKAVPKNLEEAGEADTMLWCWRHSGKSWKEIYDEWERITGKVPGKSTLSVRWIKLCDNFMASGGVDDMMLLKYREIALKEMEPELWDRVAAKISENHEATFSAGVLRKRYNALRNNGFQVGEEFEEEEEMEGVEEDADARPRTDAGDIQMSMDDPQSTVPEDASGATLVRGGEQIRSQSSVEEDRETRQDGSGERIEADTKNDMESDATPQSCRRNSLVDYESD